MKAAAIVYTSNTGFTKRYAELLGQACHLPVYDLATAQRELAKDRPIVYLGWLMAGSVKGLKKAAANWTVMAVCPVGMGPNDGDQATSLREKKVVPPEVALFYLRGGYAPDRMTGIYKIMMKTMGAAVGKGAQVHPEDAQAAEMAQAFQSGNDWVSADQLAPVIEYL